MKKLLLAAAALIATASAAHADSMLSFALQGEVAAECTITTSSITPTETVALNGVEQQLGGVTYTCSAPSFTRTIESANAGVLERMGGDGGDDDTLDYTIRHGGGSGLAFASTALTSPIVTALTGSEAFAAGQTGSIYVTPENAETAGVTAGVYVDTITITLIAS